MRKVCMGLIGIACCAMASADIAHAQETINQATISGRVLDAQGAAVAGATVSVRQTDTNVTMRPASSSRPLAILS